MTQQVVHANDIWVYKGHQVFVFKLIENGKFEWYVNHSWEGI